MNKPPPPSDAKAAFEVALDAAPKAEIIEAEEDEADAARRAAALASTFDPDPARAGKSDEALIAEREAQTRQLIDVAIAVGVVAAVVQAEQAETQTEPETDVTWDTAPMEERWDDASTEALTSLDLDDGD